MHKRVSGNICPLVSWLQIIFSRSNCLCAIGIKSSFRNGEVNISHRAVGKKGRFFPVAVGAGLGQSQDLLATFLANGILNYCAPLVQHSSIASSALDTGFPLLVSSVRQGGQVTPM